MLANLLSIACTDDGLGRFSSLCISDQTLMEMLVQDFEDVNIAKAGGNFIDISEWSILCFDDSGSITAINIDIDDTEYIDDDPFYRSIHRSIKESCFDGGGSIDFKYVPQTVTSLTVSEMSFKGTIETRDLPSGLIRLNVYGNYLMGSFDISGLPECIERIDIARNELTGSLKIEFLPESVKELCAISNNFSGTLNMAKLPPKVESLVLSCNRFTGKIELPKVPSSLCQINLDSNLFDRERLVIDSAHKVKRFLVDDCFKGSVFDPSGVKIDETRFDFVKDDATGFFGAESSEDEY